MFGHADSPESIIPKIEAAIEYMHTFFGISAFYVGNRGQFDHCAATAAKLVKQKYPKIQLFLLLSYHPAERPVDLPDGFDNSYYPLLKRVPRQYAIARTNRYMVDTADAFICYVKHIGNSRNLLEYAQRRQKKEGIPIENVAEDS